MARLNKILWQYKIIDDTERNYGRTNSGLVQIPIIKMLVDSARLSTPDHEGRMMLSAVLLGEDSNIFNGLYAKHTKVCLEEGYPLEAKGLITMNAVTCKDLLCRTKLLYVILF